MSGLMNSYYAISEQHAAEIAKLKTELSTLRGAAEEMGKLVAKWRKAAENSRRHWLKESRDTNWGTELETNMNDLNMCADQLESALARYQKLITKKEN